MVLAYDVAIDTPKRHMKGTVTIDAKGSNATMKLETEELGCIEADGTRVDMDYEFAGSVDVEGVGSVEYSAKGQLWGNSLDFTAETSAGKVVVYGARADEASKDSRVVDQWNSGDSIIDYLL